MKRRQFLQTLALGTAAWSLPVFSGRNDPYSDPLITKTIPSSGATVPVIGMGTWITFDVGDNRAYAGKHGRLPRQTA